jgi:hypothetical protein
MLQTNSGREVGVLNTQTSRALRELDRQSLVNYAVYIAADEWESKIQSFMTMGKSACFDVNIFFFGSLSNSSPVGKILSDTGHFLQPPYFLDSSIPYNNPHEITFPSIGESESRLHLPTAAPSALTDLSVDMINTLLGDLGNADSLGVQDVNKDVLRTELKL